MSKAIISPAKCWPGTIIISDPLTLPQFQTWNRGAAAAVKVVEANGLQSDYDAAILPGICACVERWELTGDGWPVEVTPATFPATPRKASIAIIQSVTKAITALINADDDSPKAD